jgi:hypothetical protein
MKSKSRLLKVSLIGLSAIAAAAAAAACSTTDAGDDSAAAGSGVGGTSSPGTGGTTGGSTPIAGSTSTGGSSVSGGTGGGAANPVGVACPKAMTALLTDFTQVDGGGLGNFGAVGSTFAGGTFQFPDAITSDFSMDNWHVSGMVTDYAAFALFFQDCNEVDASMFKGISFTVKGTIPSPMTPNTLNFQVGTAADDISTEWLSTHVDAGAATMPTFGRCTPTSSNQYDGSCGSPSFTVPVTDTATKISIMWADLKGGKPTATVDPHEITSVIWGIPAPAGAGSATITPYAIDVTIDDLSFIE